jgi:hypothetical protein
MAILIDVPTPFGWMIPSQSIYSDLGVTRNETILDNYRLWAEDDIVCLQAGGPITSSIVDWLIVMAKDITARHSHYYILGDLRGAGPITPALRRRLAEFGTAYPPRAIAFFHVSLMIQGVNALLFGALNLLSKRRQPFRQCATEAEAREWLRSQR